MPKKYIKKYPKPKLYSTQKLTGMWQITLKLDGVRAFIEFDSYVVTSRAGKPLYNFSHELIDKLKAKYPDVNRLDCEIFRNSWEDTMSLLRSNVNAKSEVTEEDIYILTDDYMDRRLHLDWILDPEANEIVARLEEVRDAGHEGLVIRKGTKWYKVKPTETHDEPITDVKELYGQPDTCEHCNTPRLTRDPRCGHCKALFREMTKVPKGVLGALVTARGRVGSGFSQREREWLWSIREELVGTYVEVTVMEITNNGKFRLPRFVRLRTDK